MNLTIYNTLSRKKEKFIPINKDYVGMYVCGPTVYGSPHLGHARPAITFDIVFRYLKHLGYKVRYVRNITDAGHLENDADEGEDKIAKKAVLEKLEPMEIVQKYTLEYHSSLELLNCLSPSIEPRATGHVIEQIEMVKKMIANGFAYEQNGSVYLDVTKYNKRYPYGVLSGRKIDDTLEGTRELHNQSEKKNSVDFAIWKKANKNHIMRWSSPWGEGFPGWHLECSAMSAKYLGKTFDIHGGGMDLMFPHHEAEIAQSHAANNCAPAKYWMHNNMITIDGQKMGKSLNNFINLEEFFSGNHEKLERAYQPMTIRFFILQAHYRGTLDFSNSALAAAEKGFLKLVAAIQTLKNITPNKFSSIDIKKIEEKYYSCLNDDFNTPILIAHLFDSVKIINSLNANKETLNKKDLKKFTSTFEFFIVDILGLKPITEKKINDNNIEGIMKILLELRNKAKQNKDYITADMIRDELDRISIQIKDRREGTTWNMKKND